MKVSVEFQEPDRKKRIKRIIAREGLIIIIFTTTFFIGWWNLGNFLQHLFFIGLFGYPFYLLIRFILWAVRTLKQKE